MGNEVSKALASHTTDTGTNVWHLICFLTLPGVMYMCRARSSSLEHDWVKQKIKTKIKSKGKRSIDF